MVFCNWSDFICDNVANESHNPYFNRWFSAIKNIEIIDIMQLSHNPYFNRWFSAIQLKILMFKSCKSHNPYFNRWFSAIYGYKFINKNRERSQSLF